MESHIANANCVRINCFMCRLGLMAIADYVINLQILSETRKKNPVIPKHIPATCSVRHFFTHCAAIRSIPKKVKQ